MLTQSDSNKRWALYNETFKWLIYIFKARRQSRIAPKSESCNYENLPDYTLPVSLKNANCFNYILRNYPTACFTDLGKLNLVGSILSSSQYSLLTQQPLKATLAVKVIKTDSKIVI
jgi:hypothetical protein